MILPGPPHPHIGHFTPLRPAETTTTSKSLYSLYCSFWSRLILLPVSKVNEILQLPQLSSTPPAALEWTKCSWIRSPLCNNKLKSAFTKQPFPSNSKSWETKMGNNHKTLCSEGKGEAKFKPLFAHTEENLELRRWRQGRTIISQEQFSLGQSSE